MKNFKERIKQARINSGYTSAAKFAISADMEPPAYRAYERGNATPPLSRFSDICRLLKITPNDLLLDK